MSGGIYKRNFVSLKSIVYVKERLRIGQRVIDSPEGEGSAQ